MIAERAGVAIERFDPAVATNHVVHAQSPKNILNRPNARGSASSHAAEAAHIVVCWCIRLLVSAMAATLTNYL